MEERPCSKQETCGSLAEMMEKDSSMVLDEDLDPDLDTDLDTDLDILDNERGLVDNFVFGSPPPGTASVENENVDDDHKYTDSTGQNNHYIKPYPGDAGHSIRKTKTRYENWLENQRCEEKKPWDPFEDEWVLTMWLLNNVGQKATDQFLKLPIVSEFFQSV